MAGNQRIAKVDLEADSRIRLSPQAEHECRVAIHDLLEENVFTPAGDLEGPFHLALAIEDGRLKVEVRSTADAPLALFTVPLGDFRHIIKDYFRVLGTYFDAIKCMSPSRIESIDMGRRALHDEGSRLLKERLEGHVAVDMATARRLFTLICVMHIQP